MFTKEELQEQLKTGPQIVTFTKADGTERVMRCTLNESYLPLQEEKETKRKPNDEVVPVWDLDKNAWRSFRVDSVKSITAEKE